MHNSVVSGYNQWAATYDSMVNKTRDMEAACLLQLFAHKVFTTVVEMGCGTGKNTAFLQTISKEVYAFDASEAMLQKAKEKTNKPHVHFSMANLLQPWPVAHAFADAVIFSLVLEHIQDLTHPFAESARVLQNNGLLYVGELHPFKQYSGSGARFQAGNNTVHLPVYTHHLSDYINAARAQGLTLIHCIEPMAADEEIPQVLALLFQKINSGD